MPSGLVRAAKDALVPEHIVSHVGGQESKILSGFTGEAVMPRFSERIGYRPIRTVVQIEGMDDELRNSLWNLVCEHYFAKYAVADEHEWTTVRRRRTKESDTPDLA